MPVVRLDAARPARSGALHDLRELAQVGADRRCGTARDLAGSRVPVLHVRDAVPVGAVRVRAREGGARAGTRSTTASPARPRPAPRSCCCTTTRARRPRAACAQWGFVRGGMGTLTGDDGRRRARGRLRDPHATPRSSAILTRGGRAAGVRARDGEELRAPRVLSNADPSARSCACATAPTCPPTFVRADRGLPLRWARASRSTSRSASCRTVHGLPEGGVQPYHTGHHGAEPVHRRHGHPAGAGACRASPPIPRTSSCASRRCTIRRSRPRASTSSRST